MSHRETWIPPHALKQRVLHEAEHALALGALASDERASYLFLEQGGIHELTAAVGDGDELFACSPDLPLFMWDERDMHGKHGIALRGMPQETPAMQGRGLTTIVVGPVHAGIIEPGRFTLHSGGETVVHLDVQLGFSHRHTEERMEGRGALDAAPSIARICGACSVARSWTYARAIERLAGLECDEHLERARLVFAELERLYNHIFDLASASAAAGYQRGQIEGLRLKERVQRLCAVHGGHRFLFDTIVPGGVREGVLADPAALRAALRALRGDVERYGASLFATSSLIGRFETTGVVSPAIARAFGAVGPALRASGGNGDVRAIAPYGAYREIRPSIPSAREGDALARSRIKYSEALDSLCLIDAALAELGGHATAKPHGIEPVSGRTIAASEGPRGAEVLCVEADAGRLRRIHVISASFRNWPIVVRAMEGNIVPDFPLVNKSFNLCYACADR